LALLRKGLEFGRSLKLKLSSLERRLKVYSRRPDKLVKKGLCLLQRRVPPLGGENYDWHWKYLSFRNKTVLDLGADYGSTADYFLRNGASKVIAVEGNKNYANKFYRLLGNDKRIVYLPMWICSGKTIDSLVELYIPDVVKVDIEGQEKLLLDVNVGRVKEWLVETHMEQLYQVISKFFVHNGFKVSTVEYGKTLGAPQIKVLIAKGG